MVVPRTRPSFRDSRRWIASQDARRNWSCPHSSSHAALAVALSSDSGLDALPKITRPPYAGWERFVTSYTFWPTRHSPRPRRLKYRRNSGSILRRRRGMVDVTAR